jgi:hypothetical protein
MPVLNVPVSAHSNRPFCWRNGTYQQARTDSNDQKRLIKLKSFIQQAFCSVRSKLRKQSRNPVRAVCWIIPFSGAQDCVLCRLCTALMTAHSESRDFLLPVDVSGPMCLAGWSLMYDSLTFVDALMLEDHRRLLCSHDHTIRPRGHTRKLAFRPLENLDTLQHEARFPVIIGANWRFASTHPRAVAHTTRTYPSVLLCFTPSDSVKLCTSLVTMH